MQNNEFCFVSIVKRGHLLLLNFLPLFLIKVLENPKKAKNNKNPKNIFLIYLHRFEHFQRHLKKN
jgi:hypothetical protein